MYNMVKLNKLHYISFLFYIICFHIIVRGTNKLYSNLIMKYFVLYYIM